MAQGVISGLKVDASKVVTSGIKDALLSLKGRNLIIGIAKAKESYKLVCYPANKPGDKFPGLEGVYGKQKTLSIPQGKRIYVVTTTSAPKPGRGAGNNINQIQSELYAYLYVETKDGNSWAAVTKDNYRLLMNNSEFEKSSINDILQNKVQKEQKQKEDNYNKRDQIRIELYKPLIDEFLTKLKSICKVLQVRFDGDYSRPEAVRIAQGSFSNGNLGSVELYWENSTKGREIDDWGRVMIPKFSFSSSAVLNEKDAEQLLLISKEISQILPLAIEYGKNAIKLKDEAYNKMKESGLSVYP